MWDSPIGVATLERQIKRMRRWGLVPVWNEDEQRMVVAEETLRADGHHGLVELVRGPHREIASVDDNRPLAAVMANRVSNGEVDLAARMRAAERAERLEREREIAETRREMRDWWRARKRLQVALRAEIAAAERR